MDDRHGRSPAVAGLQLRIALLDTTLDSVMDGILVVDSERRVVKFNEAFADMCRSCRSPRDDEDEDAVFSLLLDQLVAPEEFSATVNALHAASTERSSGVLQFKDGRIFEQYSRPQRLGEDAVGRIWCFRDVTEQKRAEAALREACALLEGVIESPKEVVVFALDRQYRYLSFNRNHRETMKRIWGADISLGTCMLDYIRDAGDRDRARRSFDRALSGESFVLQEAYGDTALERRYYEDIYNPVTDENGTIIGLSLFLTDITERRIVEEQRDKLIAELRDALAKVKMLSGLLPVCAHCSKIRDEAGRWQRMETYVRDHSEADFSHGICPDCAETFYPGLFARIQAKQHSSETRTQQNVDSEPRGVSPR